MNIKKNAVLVIDDEIENIKALRHILSKDHTIFAEIASENAYATVKKLSPDLILLDVMMPGIDGFEVISQLKADKATKNIPVIFVTGRTSADDEANGLALGAVDYINKPFSAPIVEMRVANQMKILNQMREIEKLSTTDALTGIGNRLFFNTLINHEWESAKRQQTHISFIIFDIDNFKNFNDTYGHLNGDIALKTVAATIRAELTRGTDEAARWGGEEFAVILPGTQLSGALQVAENIRTAVERTKITLADNSVVSVSVSGGLRCVIPERSNEYGLNDFFKDADEALYMAKRTGKNKICVADKEQMQQLNAI